MLVCFRLVDRTVNYADFHANNPRKRPRLRLDITMTTPLANGVVRGFVHTDIVYTSTKYHHDHNIEKQLPENTRRIMGRLGSRDQHESKWGSSVQRLMPVESCREFLSEDVSGEY